MMLLWAEAADHFDRLAAVTCTEASVLMMHVQVCKHAQAHLKCPDD